MPSPSLFADPAPTDDGLQSVATAAAREQARLEARSGQSRLLGLLTSLGLRVRHLGSEEVARSGLRYQPVAWTVIAVVAIAVVFPGRPDGSSVEAELAQAPIALSPSPTSPPLEAAPSEAVELEAPSFEFTYSPPPPPATPYVAPTPAPAGVATATTLPARATPLVVRGFGWASSLSGTGISSSSVPEGTMPVGARLNELDKVSFLRLSGTGSKLVLTEDTAGAREALGNGAVRACVIVDAGWVEEADQAMSDAPEINTDRCVDGVEDADRWTFDLSGFSNRAAQTGFALLPAANAPADFQLTFRPR